MDYTGGISDTESELMEKTPPPHEPSFKNLEKYQRAYAESINNPHKYWDTQARELLHWYRPYDTVHSGSFAHGDNAWFLEGQLNASYNCIDRHAFLNPDRIAIIHEGDEPGNTRKISYSELLREVSRISYVLEDMGVRKGDAVAIYLPNVPEAIIAMLACARIGAVHSVVFMGFSAAALRDRILDADCKVVITSNEARRGGKSIPTKRTVEDALLHCPEVTGCLVLKHTASIDIPWCPSRDVWWHKEAVRWGAYFPPKSMSAEDPLFLLYTSGSTGKPKGLLHTTAGYLLGAAVTTKHVFNMHELDTIFCAGDVGWITGHTYLVYGPLLLGITTVVYEGSPSYPTPSRFWDIIEEHAVTHFYTAPTALRLLKRAGLNEVPPMKHLRVLGSIGEPIAPELWRWYHDTIGRQKAHVVDTYFQTETGCHVLSPLAGVIPTKPGSCTLPFLGIVLALLDPLSGEELKTGSVEGLLAIKHPWPSMARSVWRDHERYKATYLEAYPGYYFTGDAAYRDEDGYYWVRGRVDDVVNVSGHRLSTAELEAALLEHPLVAEAAVVGTSDAITGQTLVVFVSAKDGEMSTTDLKDALIAHIRKSIGAFATPRVLYLVADLPKTRSGKIMRRVLRKIVDGERENFGDLSTLVDPNVVQSIIHVVEGTQVAESGIP